MNIEKIKKGDIFKTCMKSYLRFDYKTDTLYHFTLVTRKGDVIPDERNKFGAVKVRSKKAYSEEVVLTFKKVKI